MREWSVLLAISGPLEGGFMDWPANIQDKILAAIEKHEKQHNVKLEMVAAEARCDVAEEGWYVHCLVRTVSPILMPNGPTWH